MCLTTGESDKVSTNAEASARAGSDGHAWDICVKDAECGSSCQEQ